MSWRDKATWWKERAAVAEKRVDELVGAVLEVEDALEPLGDDEARNVELLAAETVEVPAKLWNDLVARARGAR